VRAGWLQSRSWHARVIGLGLACALLCLAGCSSSANNATATNSAGKGAASPASGSKLTLHLGYFPNVTHATALVGVSQGIFARDLGANVSLQTATFNAGPAEVEALFSGALDAAYMGPNPAVNAYVQSGGSAVRVISGATACGAFLVVRSDINTAADLRGKTVASPQLGNTQDVALRSWLQKQGLKTDINGGGDLSVLPQDNSVTLTAFKSGQIAGAWVPEPWASRLLQEGGGKVLVDERDLWPGGAYVTTQLVVRTDFLQKHPDVITALLHGQIDANAFLGAQPQQAQQIVNDSIAQITGQRLASGVLAAAWKNLTFSNDPVASSLRKAANDAQTLGLLKLNGVDLNGLYDLAPLNALLKAAGQPEVTAS
jgi:NitT/TauT family transport system substrate-binding protein